METNSIKDDNQKSNTVGVKSTPSLKRPLRVSDLVLGLRKYTLTIVLCAVVGLIVGILLSIVSFMRGEMSKQYAVKTTIGVTSQNDDGLFVSGTGSPSNYDISLAEDMVDSVMFVLKSDKMLNKVINDSGLLGVSTRDLYDNLQLSQYNQTQIIDITLYWRSAQEGVEILQAFNRAAPDVLIETLKIGSVTVINDPTARYLIGGSFNMALWGYMMILGAVIGLGYSVFKMMLHPTLLNSSDIEKNYQIEILGEIPENKEFFKKKRDLVAGNDDDELYAAVLDNYISVAQILKKRIQKIEHPCVYVTSSAQNEGKTTATAYLGADLAELGLRVLLIDFDIKNPKLGGFFLNKVEYENSVNALYRGESSKEEAIVSITPKLDILPAILERKSLVFDDALLKLVSDLKTDYDVVLMDTAPIGLSADTMSLNSFADLCLFVVRFDSAGIDVIREAIGRLDKTDIRIAGCLVNAVRGFRSSRTTYDSRSSRSQGGKRRNRNKTKSIQKQEWEQWEKDHNSDYSQEADSSAGDIKTDG